MKQYERGLAGEQAAEAWLCGRGMTCLDRRFRAARGEIDLIMQDQDGVLVFVEVKYRPHGHAGDGLLAVTADKQRRTAGAATVWLVQHQLYGRAARFDVIEITMDGVRHVPNAWMLA